MSSSTDQKHKNDPARAAIEKLKTGTFMRLDEVAALFDVTPITVHKLPLPSIRLGRSLRFDPTDVRELIEASKEEVVC